MSQTAAQINVKLYQFLNDIWVNTSLPDFGYPSHQLIYLKILVPHDDDDIDMVRAKLHLLMLAAAQIPDLDEEIFQTIRKYAKQVECEERDRVSDEITITDDDLPF